mgnify:CR=1 FL=1
MHLYPQADVPVVQVALPVGAGPKEVLALGRALAALPGQGVLAPGCYGYDPAFKSESSDYSVFNSYCSNWSGNGNVSYYGNRRAGCVLMLVVNGTMPSGSPGGWAYQDEYLQWYCSSNGPGGGVFGF